MRIRLGLCLAIPVLSACLHSGGTGTLDDVAAWRLLGVGEVATTDAALELREGPGSKGVMLLTRELYGRHVSVEFEAKPSQHEGVVVVLLSASPQAGHAITVPDGYDGNWAFWKSDDAPVRSYAFAFHTGYHQPNAFLRKNPGFHDLALAPDPVTDERWVRVRLGRRGAKLWLDIDGVRVLTAEDPEAGGLPAGHLALRLRGPGDGSFSCLFRGLSVRELSEPGATSASRPLGSSTP